MLFAATAVLLTTGCHEPRTAQTPNQVSSVSVNIDAAMGGEVAVGNAKLIIPPNALDQDTEITLEMRAADATNDANDVVKGMVFDFGPDGLQFSEPAVLEFDVQANTFTQPGAVSKYDPNLGLWDQLGPTGSVYDPNLGLWDQTGDSSGMYDPNLGLWDSGDPDKLASGVPGFSEYATTLPGHGVYSCGIESAGTLCCWGLRETDCTGCQPAASAIPTTSDFIDVATGAWSDCGLKFDGSIECWGSNPPVAPSATDFVQLSMGRFHACGLKEDGSIDCFMAGGRAYDVPDPAGTDFVSVTSGDFHACGLRTNGSIDCWGVDRDGSATPPGGMGYVDVDAGSRHTCAVAGDGSIECWGSDISGLTRSPSGTNFTEVSVGVFAACALTDLGEVVCWGADYDVVTGTPNLSGYSQVVARHRHACAISPTGNTECWGQDISGSLAPPAGCLLPPEYEPSCEIGYEQGPNGCQDIDECALGGACDANATCTNTPGDFMCMCNSGFTGDGFTCMPDSTVEPAILAAGGLHNCQIVAGAIYCWGDNLYGQLGDGTNNPSPMAVRVGAATNWVSIAAGADHSCAINDGGELWCWGANFGGGLGDGSMTDSSVPVRESTNATNWAQVTAGVGHTCALNTAGEIYCWGEGMSGQLGDGTTGQQSNPTRENTNATNWAQVEAGGDHTCALDDMGNLSCWGGNFAGQLGNNMMGTDSSSPVMIGGGPWDDVALGGGHTCATRGGELFCWGSDIGGQLGINGGGDMDFPTPQRVGSDTDWAIPAAGGDNTCALKTSGDLWCWGYNLEGQVGAGDTMPYMVPVRVGMAGDWNNVQIPVIGQHTCGIRDTGETYCWGSNFDSQVGRPSSRPRPTMTSITPGTWSSVSAYGGEDIPFVLGLSSFACGIQDGGPFCWGYSAFDFNYPDYAVPVATTMGQTNWTQVSSSPTHACGLQNGAPRCWGANPDGGLGDATNMGSPGPVVASGTAADMDWTEVSAGSGFSCGIKSGGLWCWGRGLEGQLGDGQSTSTNTPAEVGATTGTAWSTVSAGHTHVCAIHGGDLYCWGGNSFGQLGNGTTTPDFVIPAMPTIMGTSFTSVSAGQEHTCAIDTGGNLLCAGDNTTGELGDGSTTPSTTFVTIGGALAPWSQVSVGRDNTCGIASNMVYCWGANQFGQVGDGTLVDASTPVAVNTTFTDWVEVTVGDVFTCGRRTGGEVHCWGDNGQGQMGDGSLRFLVPTLVSVP